jgi:hypothetical protein
MRLKKRLTAPGQAMTLMVTTATMLGTLVIWTPSASAATMPPVTLSRYVSTTDMHTMGCNQRKLSDEQSQSHEIVILNFGDPGWVSYGTWGAWDDSIGGFNSNATIEKNVKEYMRGFWNCTAGDSKPFMTVALGVTNASSGINSRTSTATALGSGWGHMIDDLNSWIAANGYGSQLTAAGAIDAEPGWGPPAYALAWANGFMSAAGSTYYYDFGSADGCPILGCSNGWSPASLYQIAWGNATALAVPEIYNNSMAQQWAAISAWGSANTSDGPIRWTAALSQNRACSDSNDPCTGEDNSPHQSWQQLTTASGIAPRWATQMSYSPT